MYLLDSDVLIDIQRGHPPAVNWASSWNNPIQGKGASSPLFDFTRGQGVVFLQAPDLKLIFMQ
jgi:hypothetical protein